MLHPGSCSGEISARLCKLGRSSGRSRSVHKFPLTPNAGHGRARFFLAQPVSAAAWIRLLANRSKTARNDSWYG